MKTYNIWSEGFRTSGMNEKAMNHGCYEGNTFQEACEKWADTLGNSKKLFDKKRLTFWACRLFDNESDARKSFG